MKKEDQFYRVMQLYGNCRALRPSELVEGRYVARANSREKRIENKYIVVSNRTVYYGICGDLKTNKVTCYDFIENKLIDFDGRRNGCDFIRADANNNDDFDYKYKYSSLNKYKKLKVGDEVVFINPENIDSIETRQNPIFKIIKKQKLEADYGRFDLIDDTGYVLQNVPAILIKESDLNQTMIDEYTEKKKEEYANQVKALEQILDKEKKFYRPTDFIRSTKQPKTPSKLKFSVDIDYSDNTSIEILFKDNDSSCLRKALMYDLPLDEKIKISNILKNVFKKIYYNEDYKI